MHMRYLYVYSSILTRVVDVSIQALNGNGFIRYKEIH